MELKHYLQIMRRWIWLLILGLILGGIGGYVASRLQEPVYQSSTRALVMRAPLEQSSDLTYYSDIQLVQTYVQLLTTQPVLDGASQRLGYEVGKSQIKVKQNQDTQIIDLTIEDNDPVRAANIANVLVAVLIEQNNSLQAGRYVTTEESIQAQITQVEDQIATIQTSLDAMSTQNFEEQLASVETQIQPLQDEVSQLQQEIAALSPGVYQTQRTQIAEKEARIAQIKPLLDLYQQIYSNLVVLGKPVDIGTNDNSRFTQLQSTLQLYQQLYLNLLSSLETIHLARLQNTPNIVQIESAVVPGEPVRPRPIMNVALAGMIGLMLAAGGIFLIEYLDDTLKTPEEIERVLGVPVLGFVADMHIPRKQAEDIHIMRYPRSPVAEAFRSLRTNLESASLEKPIRTILVTSIGPSEGKTTVAANLAATFSHNKKMVVLMDADLRRPFIHRLFGLANRKGLNNLLTNGDRIINVGRMRKDLPNLLVITSGSPPPNPTELLGSTKMGQILSEIGNHVNMLVIDTPPSLVADAQILASRVDAVLFVIQPGVTRADMAAASMESFKRSGARIVGVVMNRIPKNRGYYYGGYKYYSSHDKNKHYYSYEESKSPPKEDNHSVMQKIPQTTAQQPVQTPVQKPVQKADGNQRVQEPVQSRHIFMEKPSPFPGNNGNSIPDDLDDDDEHPSVEKLFEKVEALPNRDRFNTNNNGWN